MHILSTHTLHERNHINTLPYNTYANMSSAFRKAVNRNSIEANKMPSSEGKMIRLSRFLNTTKRPGTWNLQWVALHANTIY